MIAFMVVFFAGYINHKAWEVTMVKGRHESIISMDVVNNIDDRLSRMVK